MRCSGYKCNGVNFIAAFQSHVLVSVIGDAFRASKKEQSVRGGRDLIVEALRHKVSSSTFTIRAEVCCGYLQMFHFILYSVYLK